MYILGYKPYSKKPQNTQENTGNAKEESFAIQNRNQSASMQQTGHCTTSYIDESDLLRFQLAALDRLLLICHFAAVSSMLLLFYNSFQ